YAAAVHPRDLPSFPTRRSSDLIRFGHAQALADAGFEAIMPDLRAHGESASPHAESGYPAGVLVRDLQVVIEATGSGDFDLVGFSDRKSTRLNSSHLVISYAVFC